MQSADGSPVATTLSSFPLGAFPLVYHVSMAFQHSQSLLAVAFAKSIHLLLIIDGQVLQHHGALASSEHTSGVTFMDNARTLSISSPPFLSIVLSLSLITVSIMIVPLSLSLCLSFSLFLRLCFYVSVFSTSLFPRDNNACICDCACRIFTIHIACSIVVRVCMCVWVCACVCVCVCVCVCFALFLFFFRCPVLVLDRASNTLTKRSGHLFGVVEHLITNDTGFSSDGPLSAASLCHPTRAFSYRNTIFFIDAGTSSASIRVFSATEPFAEIIDGLRGASEAHGILDPSTEGQETHEESIRIRRMPFETALSQLAVSMAHLVRLF